MEPKTKIRCCPFCGGEGEIISDSDSGEDKMIKANIAGKENILSLLNEKHVNKVS